ncbi:MAG: Ig-like domain-containing protein, partial [Verrucomicrobia bacterium]|nr:Ig-like domain-containing protein [Verrucomicrobiota bacterium]
ELAITSAGVLTFVSAPDYETKSSYTATVTATDGANSTTQSITVTVTDVNESPSIAVINPSSSESGFIRVSVADAQTSAFTVTASDPDSDSLTFSLSGADAALFLVSSSGVISFKTAPDYEAPTDSDGDGTYVVTVTVTDGSLADSITVLVAVSDTQEEAFTGKVIDGYISGATIFIDQNFNFKHDSGEYAGLSDANGAFSIIVESSKVSCLKSRPIVANVPVGAVDSTLGTVTQAYQMILPSIEDTGSSAIVISPFTSLFAEAILSAKSNLKEDLTVDEGCSSTGDDIASTISSRIDSLKLSISNSFGISFTDLTSDFIASSGLKVNEAAAQNIAKLLPYLQKIDNQVSDGLTSKFGKEIRANVSLSESALAIIFGGSSYDKLPLDFKSVYRTDANAAGWYQEESLEASGAFISDSGVLSRADCSETDTELCNITDLSLKNISNASTSYTQSSNFFNSSIDFNDINVTSGTLYVNARDSRAWRNDSANWQDKNNRDRECQSDNQIRFQNSLISGTKTEFQYISYSQGYQKADCDSVRHYYFPTLKTQTFIENVSDSSLEMSYYVHDINRSGISNNFPYDFISNRVTIDPTAVIKEIAAFPRTLAEIDNIRRMLNGGDYVLYVYHKEAGPSAYFEIGTNPRNDMFADFSLYQNFDVHVYGQDARDAFFNRLNSESAFTSNIYGDSAPVNSGVLGRISNSLIEVIDYSGSDQIKIPVYPTYDAASKTMDFSINGASLDLENIHSFIENGINGTPVSANVWYNPDDSISSVVPVKLYLYKGTDTNLDPGEGYFSIEFDLAVSSTEGTEENPKLRTATQTWEIPADSTIIVKYTEDTVTLSKNISNSDADKIVLSDEGSSVNDLDDALIGQPSTLNAKILTLITEVSSSIDGIKGFFTDGGTYTMKVDLASGGHSLIGYYRNTIDYITGTFTVKSTPTYPISVNDMRIHEGDTEDLCFYRPSKGNLDATSFNLSFTQRERPGKGAFADDF